jgi:toluene monooxygenase electron transfer component
VQITVVTREATLAFPCEPGEKLLHAGLRAGISLPYECATGTCGTCKARLVDGRADSAWSGAPGERTFRAPGELLTCQSIALTDCTLSMRALRATPDDGGAPPPRRLRGWLHDARALTADVIALDVQLDRDLEFAAGQFALVTVPGIRGARAYSMVDAGSVARRLTFVVKRREGGAVSEWLWSGANVVGRRLDLFAPLGIAVFNRRLERHVLCLAGGSGVAGMLSILGRGAEDGHFTRWNGDLVFGVRRARDLFFLDELRVLRARNAARLSIVIALSDEDVPESLAVAHRGLSFARGPVHAVAARHMEGRFGGVRAYVAGPPPMVEASLRVLLSEGRLSPAEIRYDKFA